MSEKVNKHGCYIGLWTYGKGQTHNGMLDIFCGVENVLRHCTTELRAHLPKPSPEHVESLARVGMFEEIERHIAFERVAFEDAQKLLRTFAIHAKPGEFEVFWGIHAIAISGGEGFEEVKDYDEMREDFIKREHYAEPPKDEDRAIAARLLRLAAEDLAPISPADLAACERVASWLDFNTDNPTTTPQEA